MPETSLPAKTSETRYASSYTANKQQQYRKLPSASLTTAAPTTAISQTAISITHNSGTNNSNIANNREPYLFFP